MSGMFSVPKEGLFNVSVDDILKHAEATRGPALSQEEADARVAEEALEFLRGLESPALFMVKGADGQPLLIGKGREWVRLRELLSRVPDGPDRRKIIHKLRRHFDVRERATRAKQAETERQLKYLRSLEAGCAELNEWGKQPPKLERPDGTILHQFRDALAAGRVCETRELNCAMTAEGIQAWSEVAEQAEVFVVQHNWAAAFEGAADYDVGEIHLPNECCAFEFRVTGRPVIAFATEVDGSIYLQMTARASNDRWFIYDVAPHALDVSFGPDEACEELVAKSIRAIVIALDAEVAVTEVIRAPHKLNSARDHRGKLPIASYHIVSLASRSRAVRLERDANEPPSHHKRLHFRRGHWRHFETFKTWIRWTLVGDPDLGFVDKHYRL